ncbi:I78 family peptidase inhibitor [Amnibacterium sp.]|uniref:I78 family peptidase inhibitor n=1 Tax=Amnibacterium sp. TaxID=1872496 RepID=UPI002631F9E1|nr:I78 family peptidase inhibitor [Amnibacterium sp.]MCU1475152.1 hypothetical protein [Amnibacterium sp.]
MTDGRTAAQGPAEARRWAADHSAALLGRPLAEAEAAAATAGLRVKVLRPTGWTTLEFGTGRITLRVDEDDRVTEARAG